MNEHEKTTIPEEIKGCVCVHDIVPEIVPNPQGTMDAMKIRVIGHKIEDPHADDELFTLLTGVPNAAIFSSRILEAVSDANPLSQVMTAMALTRELAKSDHRKTESETEDDPLKRLSEIFGDDMGGMIVPLDDEPVSKGYARNATGDDPVRILKLPGEPNATFAPIDNRDEYPEGMNGYL